MKTDALEMRDLLSLATGHMAARAIHAATVLLRSSDP